MDEKTKEPTPTPAKEPYVKPDFRCERVFEVAALQCGKVGTEGQCARNRKLS